MSEGQTSKISPGSLADEIVQNTRLHLNLAQNAIVITEDKVRLCLIEHLRKMEAKRQWIAPAGILLTIVTVFVTTEFKDFVFKAPMWEATFFIAAILNVGWLAVAVYRAVKSPSVEDVVQVMKAASVPEATTQ